MNFVSRSLTLRAVAGACALAALNGCALLSPPPPPAPPATVSIAKLYDQPAERAFVNGLRFYEEGQYDRAETLLKRSLAEGLRDPHDVSIAQKHLAFIACAYNRPTECEAAFRAAFTAEPSFKLTESEVGHPLWGPVYQRVAAEQPPAPAAAATPR